MRIRNETSWPLQLHLIDIESGRILGSAGIVPGNDTMDLALRRHSNDPQDATYVVSDSITIVEAVHPKGRDDGTYEINLSAPAVHPLIDGAGIRVTALKMPEKGEAFAYEMSGDDIEAVRKSLRQTFGRDVHIRAKIGPLTQHGESTRLGCPIAAVDDEFLQGRFGGFPTQVGNTLLVGYYL